ncbi:VWA domain-containing protein [Clostridium botulinum]|uniref:VWA domain-containing protein n=1 Tax=Clostridium botulinum TaxID=1491 RepID=A0A6M0SQF6_CLOBO|nr:VWA domain-containing protein [Clostridium botulinum]
MEEEHSKKNKIKKRVFSFFIFIIFILCTSVPIIVKANSDIPQFDISISANPQSANIGEDIVVSGTITPKDFTAEVKPKDVVLVLDISGSMSDDANIECTEKRKTTKTNYYEEYWNGKWYSHNIEYYVNVNDYCSKHRRKGPHNERKIDELKKSALTFIDRLKDTPNLRISIVDFNTGSVIKSDFSSDFENLKEEINKLSAGGGTNIGGGLRQAAYLLSNSSSKNSNDDKYVVFMSDGQPTDMYIKDYVNKNNNFIDLDYYTDISQKENGKEKNGVYYKYPLRYSELVGQQIKNQGYTVYSIGYDLKNAHQSDSTVNQDASVTLKDIHNSMTNKEENFFESSTGLLEKIFSDIADKIAYSATDVKLNLDFPESIEIIGNQKVIPLDNIVYKEAFREGNKIRYHAEPIKFNFIIRGNTPGDFNLFYNAKITFMWDGEPKELFLDDLNVTITDPRKPKVIIKASDSAKTIEYDSSVKANNTDENYKLYGKSTLQIDAIGVDAKYLRYRFNSKNEWKYMELNRENDIDKEKPNYLTQMSYDVSHMPLRSNEEMWNNRNEVFKEPFFKDITQISTKVSSGTKGQYVEKEEIKKENGNIVTRWKPKTLFVENYDVSSYAPGYKEASKSWGYMTVPEDGEYTFKAITDDGFYGNITVDGESKVIGDAFRVKWYKDQPPASEPIKLKKGEYYPVYFEYFNWGGAACYKIECSKNGDRKTGYKEVGKMGIKFYPSKSNLPTLDANNGFMGSKFIDIPTEIAKYTLEYELVDYGDDKHANNESKGKGKFGIFEVEERFTLNKYFSQNGSKKGNEFQIDKNEAFEIKYEVKPKDIPMSELYKGKKINTPADLFYVKHITLEDILPEGLYTTITFEENNVTKEKITEEINLSKESLEYKLNGNNYVAEPYVFTVKVECRPNVSKKVSFKKSGSFGYRDVSLDDNSRISLNQCFDDELTLNIKGESEITKHGVVIEGDIKDPFNDKYEFDKLIFKKNIPYTLGFIIDAKGSDNNFTLNSKNADISKMLIYELNSEGKIIDSSKKEITDISKIGIEGNGMGSNIKQGKKYVVIYYAKFKNDIGRSEFIAKLDSGFSKNLILNFDEEMPELF